MLITSKKRVSTFMFLNTENKKNIAKNSGWLVFDHISKILAGIFVGILVARYLGPEDFGKLSYVLAITSLLVPFYTLGLDAIAPRELVYNKFKQQETINTVFLLKFLGCIFIFLLTVLITFLFHFNDKTIIILGFFIGFSFIFKSVETLDIWFLNKLQSKYSVIARNVGRIFAAGFKIVFIFMGFSVIYFGAAVTIEAFIMAVVLIYLFLKNESRFKWKNFHINFDEIKNLLKISLPFIFIGFISAAILSIDKVMLKNMLNDYAVGLYSVSALILSTFLFMINAVLLSVYPVLIKLEKDKPFEHYKKDYQTLFNYLTLAAYGVNFLVLMFSDKVIAFLWGREFIFSAEILYIHVFSLIFAFSGLCLWYWLVIKNYIRFFLITLIIGLGVNVILNYILIKSVGITGAAYASLVSYFIIYFFTGMFYVPIREIFKMQVKSIFLIDFIKKPFELIKSGF